MSTIDLYKKSMLPIDYDVNTGKLIPREDITIDESGVRMLSDMNDLFKNLKKGFTDRPLYYMYNGVCLKEHAELFKKHKLRYEYTMILPDTIKGEYIKTHGHIHYAKADHEKGMMESFEVLYGHGYFLLFTLEEDGCNVVIVYAKVGDKFIIPKEYYHLTINSGTEPFIFGDIISLGTAGNYSLLKEKHGAPIYVFKDKCGAPRFEWNDNNYPPIKEMLYCTAETLPWEISLPNDGPLYTSFISQPHNYDFLNEAY